MQACPCMVVRLSASGTVFCRMSDGSLQAHATVRLIKTDGIVLSCYIQDMVVTSRQKASKDRQPVILQAVNHLLSTLTGCT